MSGTPIIDPDLSEHLKICKAAWYEITVADNKIHISEQDEDLLDYAIGAIDTVDSEEANIIDAMES